MHTVEPFSAKNIAACPAELPPPTTIDRSALALPRFELGGRVVHAGHLVAIEVVDRELAIVRASRGHHGAAGDLGAVGEVGDEVPGDLFE